MARHAIIEKLDRELREPITSERQVVYVLVEIRKLMERNNDTEKYFALNFYCDWAMHTKLDRLGASRIVERFNQYQKFIELTQSTPHGTVPQADLQFWTELEDTFRLQKFRQQFDDYLRGNDLPDEIASEDGHWTNFLRYYFRVIEDCPLVCKASLDHVREVSISVIETEGGMDAQSAGYTVKIAWEWRPLQSPIFMRHVSVF